MESQGFIYNCVETFGSHQALSIKPLAFKTKRKKLLLQLLSLKFVRAGLEKICASVAVVDSEPATIIQRELISRLPSLMELMELMGSADSRREMMSGVTVGGFDDQLRVKNWHIDSFRSELTFLHSSACRLGCSTNRCILRGKKGRLSKELTSHRIELSTAPSPKA